VQIEVAKQKGGVGFLFWNANNDYSKPYTAMPEMRAAKGRYFRGDEVGVPSREATPSVIGCRTWLGRMALIPPLLGRSQLPGGGLRPSRCVRATRSRYQ
jgi:hypothetical protein